MAVENNCDKKPHTVRDKWKNDIYTETEKEKEKETEFKNYFYYIYSFAQEFNWKFCTTSQQYAKSTVYQIASTVAAPANEINHFETEGSYPFCIELELVILN